MPRLYTTVMPSTAITAAKDIFRISCPSTAILFIHEVRLSQENRTVLENLGVVLQFSSTDGTGTTATFSKDPLDSAFSGTGVYNLTADTTVSEVKFRDAFNIQNGFIWQPTPRVQILVPPSGRFVFRLNTAPGASTNFLSTITFESFG